MVTLAFATTSGPIAAAGGDDQPEKPCPDYFAVDEGTYMSSDVTQTYGTGEVTYVDGHATSTTRGLTLLRVENTLQVLESEVNRGSAAPAPYPKNSYSEASLRRSGDNQIELMIEEYWGLDQALPHGWAAAMGLPPGNVLGEADFFVAMHLPVEFITGSWEDYEAGRPVEFRVTPAGAVTAAAQLRERLERLHSQQHVPKSVRAEMLSASVRAEMMAAILEHQKHFMKGMFDIEGEDYEGEAADLMREMDSEEFKQHAMNSSVDRTQEYQRMMRVTTEVVSATPTLAIAGSGTKSALTLRYLNDVTIHMHTKSAFNLD